MSCGKGTAVHYDRAVVSAAASGTFITLEEINRFLTPYGNLKRAKGRSISIGGKLTGISSEEV